jgi:hypothetical protein
MTVALGPGSESFSGTGDHRDEFDWFDRLRHVHLITRRQDLQAILRARKCGKSNGRNLS